MARVALTSTEESLLDQLRALLTSRPRRAAISDAGVQAVLRFTEDILSQTEGPCGRLGPVCTTGTVCAWLGVSRQALHKAVKKGRILAFRSLERKWFYPVWQFSSAKSYAMTVAALPQILPVLAERGLDGLACAAWFEQPNVFLGSAGEGVLHEESSVAQAQTPPTPASWICSGHDVETLLEAARRAVDVDEGRSRLARPEVTELRGLPVG